MNLYARPRAKRPGPPRRGRVRDAKYLRWIRTFPCVVCLQWWIKGTIQTLDDALTWCVHGSGYPAWEGPTEAAHVGQHGISQKCSDLETIPLCAQHHRTGKDSHHVLGKRFWEHHGLSRVELIARLNALYREAA